MLVEVLHALVNIIKICIICIQICIICIKIRIICIQIFWRRVKTPDFQSKLCRHHSQQLWKLADIEWMDSEINPNLKFRMRIRLISSGYLKLYRIINIVMRFDLMKQLNGTRPVFAWFPSFCMSEGCKIFTSCSSHDRSVWLIKFCI